MKTYAKIIVGFALIFFLGMIVAFVSVRSIQDSLQNYVRTEHAFYKFQLQRQAGYADGDVSLLFDYRIKALFDYITKLQTKLLIVFLLFIPIALALAFLVSKVISDPFEGLQKVCREIKEGKYDVPMDPKLKETGEDTAVVASLVDEMRYKLSRAYKSLDDHVQEKTEEVVADLVQMQKQKERLEETERRMMGIMDQLESANLDLAKEKSRLERKKRELEKTKAELERSNEELEQFAYVASHDLQEPLRMIKSYTELIERRYKEKLDEKGIEFLNFAVDGADRMQRLMTDLLEFSRVGTRAKPFERTESNLVCDQAVENLKVRIEENKAQVRRDELPVLMADDVQLGQLFQNLIANAIKFRGKKDPRVQISCSRRVVERKIEVLKISEEILRNHLDSLQARQDVTGYHRTLKLVAAVINNDHKVLQQRGVMPPEKISDTYRRLSEFSINKAEDVIDEASRGRDYDQIQDEIQQLAEPVAIAAGEESEVKEFEWVFSVADNGIGIAKENIDKIFIIFQRLHTKEEYEGTGIGLAVCKKIIERHGGKIWVESKKGEGTTFFFTVPDRLNDYFE